MLMINTKTRYTNTPSSTRCSEVAEGLFNRNMTPPIQNIAPPTKKWQIPLKYHISQCRSDRSHEKTADPGVEVISPTNKLIAPGKEWQIPGSCHPPGRGSYFRDNMSLHCLYLMDERKVLD
jgi:hypothetical protein